MASSAVNKRFDFFKPNPYQTRAVELCAKMQKIAPNTFVAGGAVRDMLLGRKAFDIDIATEMPPEQLKKFLKTIGVKSYSLGEKFGTIGALVDGRIVEITSFREEGDYSDYRHPKKVAFIKDHVKDVLRRDITINALLYNPSKDEIIDYVGGFKDLKNKLVRFVGRAGERIKEDPLRMIRAARFASVLGFKIFKSSATAIRKHAELINKVSGERMKTELDKIFSSENYVEGLKLLDSLNLIKEILPEVERLKSVDQSKNVHAEGNVFVHTAKVLENAAYGDLVFRYVALFHDIGKYGRRVMTTLDGREHASFPNHGPAGAEMFLKIVKRLHFSRADRLRIHYLIYNHMVLLFPERIKEENLFKFAKNKYFSDLIELRIADSLGGIVTDKSGKTFKKDISKWTRLLKKAEQWKKIFANNLITGEDVMKILRVSSGAKVGNFLDKIKIMQMRGKIKTRKDALNYLRRIKSKIES